MLVNVLVARAYPNVCMLFNRYLGIAHFVGKGVDETSARSKYKEIMRRQQKVVGMNLMDKAYWFCAVLIVLLVSIDWLEMSPVNRWWIIYTIVLLFILSVMSMYMYVRYEWVVVVKKNKK
jgi:hypothetical protein